MRSRRMTHGESRRVGRGRRATPCLALVASLILSLLPAPPPVRAQPSEAETTTRQSPGPVPLRVLSPVHLLFYHLPPTPAAPLGPGVSRFHVDFSESNALHPRREVDFTFRSEVDFELTRVGLIYERGLTEDWDLGVELPLYQLHGRYLDELIAETEELFGAVKPRRRNERFEGRQNQFRYRLFAGDRLVLEGQDGSLELGDPAVHVKRALWSQAGWRPALALRAALKLPLGHSKAGFGSGEVDLVAGVATSWDLGRWTAHAGGQVILPVADFRDVPGLTALPQLAFHLDGAYSRWRRLALHVQVAAATPAFVTDHDKVVGRERPPGGDDTFEGHLVQVTPAVSWRFPNGSRLFAGVVEDFGSSENTAFDVTLFATVQWGW